MIVQNSYHTSIDINHLQTEIITILFTVDISIDAYYICTTIKQDKHKKRIE